MTAMKGGQPPQLSVLFSTDLFTLIDEDAIVPLDDVAGPEGKAWLSSYYPAFMENGQTGGKTWSIPFQRSTIVLYWNKDAFKEAGLDPEKAPASWDEMVDMSKKLVKKDAAGNVSRWGVEIPSTGYGYWMLQALAIQNGQRLARPRRGSQRLRGMGNPAQRLPGGQDRHDVAHDGQPDGRQDRGQVRFRGRHAAGEGAARLADRRRQLLHLQERQAGGAQGRPHLHSLGHGARPGGGMEHQIRLRRSEAIGL
jgi:hypothetical protein